MGEFFLVIVKVCTGGKMDGPKDFGSNTRIYVCNTLLVGQAQPGSSQLILALSSWASEVR